jgi:hypothetical protein
VRTAIRILLGLLITLGALNAHAQRIFNQAELDAMLAPIALYPDPLLTHVLNASVYPDDVAEAAAWSRANPQLQGDAALATVESTSWHPSVKALAAYPDVLIRIAESPQWLADLGEAYSGSSAYVNATIQQLRARAQASGHLRSNEQQYVYQQAQTIVVQPVYPHVVYAPYYDPYVVYGTWWWPAYRPLCWRPFVARPVFVTRIVQPVRIVQPARVFRQPVHVAREVQVTPYRPIPESRRQPIIQSAPVVTQPVSVTRPMHQSQFRAVPESQRMPIIQSAPAVVQPVRAAPPAQFTQPLHRTPVAQNAPAVQQPMRAAPPAQIAAPWHRAPVAQSAPIARSMPAPQLRATERPFSRGFQAGGGGGRSSGAQHRS